MLNESPPTFLLEDNISHLIGRGFWLATVCQ